MKRQKLWNAITNIDADFLEQAQNYNFPKPHLQHGWKIAAVAACLVLSIVATAVFWPKGNVFPGNIHLDAFAITTAELPEAPPYPMAENFFSDEEYSEAYEEWFQFRRKQFSEFPANYTSLQQFAKNTTSQFLSGRSDENPVYSPISLYLALGMLAEITDGSSREQILDLLEEEDMEDLRSNAKAIWNRNYINDGTSKTILASSLWLNENISFNKNALEALSENYYSDTFKGDVTDPEYSSAFQYWLNQQTEGMLQEQISDLKFDPQTILTLATTLYFEAKWANKFNEDKTYKEIFHAEGEDTECSFMHGTGLDTCYWGDKFIAAKKDFQYAGSITFVLPDDGYSTEDLLNDSQVLSLLAGEYKNEKTALVNYSIPKFDITSTTPLIDGLRSLGIKSVFGADADFSPITDEPAFIGEAEQSARVTLDENGCKAAVYTVIKANGAAIPEDEVDLILNKPFMFIINGRDGAPLFIGIINNPA